MEYTVIIAAAALGLSAIGFFYNLGKDTKSDKKEDDTKLDQIYNRIESVDEKIDKIAEWQREATGIHESHKQQIHTLFNRMEQLESRMEDRAILNDALKKILERMK